MSDNIPYVVTDSEFYKLYAAQLEKLAADAKIETIKANLELAENAAQNASAKLQIVTDQFMSIVTQGGKYQIVDGAIDETKRTIWLTPTPLAPDPALVRSGPTQ